VTQAFANKAVLSLDLKVLMLLAALVVTDNEFQTVGAALVLNYY